MRTIPIQAATRMGLRHVYRLPYAARTPDPIGVPQSRRAVDRRQRRAAGAHALSRDQIDLDSGFLERPQHTRMVGTVCAGSGEHERRAARR